MDWAARENIKEASLTQLSLHSPVAMAANQALIEAVKAVQDLQTSRVAVYKRFDE